MCLGCEKVWTALQIVWSTIYVIGGATQLIAGIFFLVTVPTLHLVTSNIWTGTWNVIIGIIAGMLACLGQVTARRQEMLLYMAFTILVFNCVNGILTELDLLFTNVGAFVPRNHPFYMLTNYASFATRTATAAVIFVSLLDTQCSFCSMQVLPKQPSLKKSKSSHDQVSDIEYIIPRTKHSIDSISPEIHHGPSPPARANGQSYTQSWVFETDNYSGMGGGGMDAGTTPYMKIISSNKSPPLSSHAKQKQQRYQHLSLSASPPTTNVIDNPVVLVEDISDNGISQQFGNSEHRAHGGHMRSFSRSESPTNTSSNPSPIPMYDPYLDRYRDSASSATTMTTIYRPHHHNQPGNGCFLPLDAPQRPASRPVADPNLLTRSVVVNPVHRIKATTTTPMTSTTATTTTAEPVHSNNKCNSFGAGNQHDTLMRELQQSFAGLKSTNQQVRETTPPKSSDVAEPNDSDFSKELEAALQLIQELESPSTPSRVSDARVWRSDSDKTLSAAPSLGISPPASNPCFGTTASNLQLHHSSPRHEGKRLLQADSQSTSGYNSPISATPPDWSSTASSSLTDTGGSGGGGTPTTIVSSVNQMVMASPAHQHPTTRHIQSPLSHDPKLLTFSIHASSDATTVISLHSSPKTMATAARTPPPPLSTLCGRQRPHTTALKRSHSKSITLVNITTTPLVAARYAPPPILTPSASATLPSPSSRGHGALLKHQRSPLLNGSSSSLSLMDTRKAEQQQQQQSVATPTSSPIWNVRSLLRRKKSSLPPRLCPELEAAIMKSESLAYLSKVELIARHQRNEEIQREIEERVIQQLGAPRTESHC